MTLRLALLALILPLFVFAQEVPRRRVYLLAEPRLQSMERGRVWTAVPMSMDFLYSGTATFLTYQTTGEPIATAAMALYQFGMGATSATASVNWASGHWFEYRRQAELKEFAAMPGVKTIRALSSTSSESTGFMKSRFQSSTLYFIEVEGDQVPEKFKGVPWVPVDDLEGTKLRLELKLPGKTGLPQAELSLRQLFDGAPIDPTTEAAWKSAIGDWRKELGYLDRFVTNKSAKAMKIEANLVRGEQVLPLGEWAAGKGAMKQLGMTWLERLKMFFAEHALGRSEEEARKHIQAKATVVVSDKDCTKWWRRVLGREVLAPGNP